MVEEKAFKILAIDGGGIKGLFSAKVIKQLEDEYKYSITNYFDMICGTSTGGLIALSLAAGESGSNIVDFYKYNGPKIFPHKTQLSRGTAFAKQLFWGAKYSNKELGKALGGVLGEKKMKDANCLLCIPSYNLSQGRPKVFKSPLVINGVDQWKVDPETSMVDVGLATSAAPTYFPIHQIGHEYFTDGGVWCNNPTLCGLTEALRFFYNKEFVIDGVRIKYTSIQLLSISSVDQPNGWTSKRSKNRSALKWLHGNKLLQPFMEGQSFFTDYFINTLVNSNGFCGINITYKRISHPPLSKDKINNVDLDKATNSAIDDLLALGKDEGGYLRSSRKHEIENFFSTLKTFKN